MYGTVRLINAVFYGHHGVMEEENRLGGRYEVDVEADLDLADAVASDDLNDTINYEAIYDIVKAQVTQHEYALIERLAGLIVQEVAAAYPALDAVRVTVRKIGPPVGGLADRSEVTLRYEK
jgi:dihydroneopterin aldolase